MTSANPNLQGALAGVRVLDISRVLGGPQAAQILGDHGADVIKVEPPRGDETREMGPPFRDDDGVMLAPPMFIPPFHHGGKIGEDGRRAKPGELQINLPVTRRLMAGCDIRFENPIRAGDTITATTTIANLTEKQGSTGPMLLIETATVYSNQHGAVNRVETWVVIRR